MTHNPGPNIQKISKTLGWQCQDDNDDGNDDVAMTVTNAQLQPSPFVSQSQSNDWSATEEWHVLTICIC